MHISRSEQKRRIKEIETLVVELAKLSSQVIEKCPCSQEVKELLNEASELKGGAKKRQLKYITKLLKEQPLEQLYKYLADRKGNELVKNKQFHEIEYWRDSLLNEALEAKKQCAAEFMEWTEQWDSSVAESIAKELPGAEKKTLLRLAYLFVQTRNPRHSREIFRYLMAIREQQRFGK